MAFFRVSAFLLFGVLFVWPGLSKGDPLNPSSLFRFYAMVEVNGEAVQPESGNAYTVVITREDGSHFEPAVVDSLVNQHHPTGLAFANLELSLTENDIHAGDTVIFQVYWAGSKLLVNEPEGGRCTIPLDPGGDTQTLILSTLSGPTTPDCLTPSDVEEQVATAIAQWDVGGDGRIGLEEAIRALQVVACIRR